MNKNIYKLCFRQNFITNVLDSNEKFAFIKIANFLASNLQPILGEMSSGLENTSEKNLRQSNNLYGVTRRFFLPFFRSTVTYGSSKQSKLLTTEIPHHLNIVPHLH